jgi:hypothetical protein
MNLKYRQISDNYYLTEQAQLFLVLNIVPIPLSPPSPLVKQDLSHALHNNSSTGPKHTWAQPSHDHALHTNSSTFHATCTVSTITAWYQPGHPVLTHWRELQQLLKHLHEEGKAAAPDGITYEMIQPLKPDYQQHLLRDLKALLLGSCCKHHSIL